MSDNIKFLRSKDFKFVKKLGSGGTGDTVLLLDETTNIEFAFKKFAPKSVSESDELYKRFVDEIKILFKIYHPNIVRIFNYYLYPDQNTGYIQMEYVSGSDISEYRALSSDNDWNLIFSDLINAFIYLEGNRILHRDIRPKNILITSDGKPKIIDFGFGLDIPENKNEGTSVLLNWPVTQWPEELTYESPRYTHQTEIYFLGKLLKSLDLKLTKNFKYSQIIEKMCKVEMSQRFLSFVDVSKAISKKDFQLIEFSDVEKEIYLKFAEALQSLVSKHHFSYLPVRDPEVVLGRLSEVVRIADLEEKAQDFNAIIRCFVDNSVSWYINRVFENRKLINFYNMMIEFDQDKKQTVIDNIDARLSKIEIKYEDDLPY